MRVLKPPRWKHDCLQCVFLGRLASGDLYYCEYHAFLGPGGNRSYLLRYGSEELEFWQEDDAVELDASWMPVNEGEAYNRLAATMESRGTARERELLLRRLTLLTLLPEAVVKLVE